MSDTEISAAENAAEENNSAPEAAAPAPAEVSASAPAAAPAQATGKKKFWTAAIAILIVAAAVGAWFLMESGELGSPAKKVGAIDAEAIYALDAFKNAEKEMDTFTVAKKKEFEEAVKAKNGKQGAEAELDNLSRKLQMEITQQQNKIINPLRTRAEAAVATVARSKGLTVVLDKKIVVYGIPDITEDVKKVFEQTGELKIPEEQNTVNSPIGYFDQEVVRALLVFREAEIKLYQSRGQMIREYEEKSKGLSDSEKEMMQKTMAVSLQAMQEQLMTPLYQKVTAAVNKVAEENKISLVLDKQNVMYGGRNITDKVVEEFLASVGQAPSSAAPAESASPASAPATPAPAASAK